MTREEVADDMGITKERVRQIEKAALAKLRNWAIAKKNPLIVAAYQHWKDSLNE